MEELFDWLVVAHAPGLGVNTFHTLLDTWRSPTHLLKAVHERDQIEGLGNKTLKWLKSPDIKKCEKDLAWSEQ
ncbi:MAG: hypothetical protein OEX83_06610, partial [Gammaproteobacteria bacterium]|nr:hypothetical protein [Gammaproteobacteria bacterium]